jgi:hypothetical protein
MIFFLIVFIQFLAEQTGGEGLFERIWVEIKCF